MGRPRVLVLSDDEIESIHLSSIHLLEHVGMIVPVQEALDLLDNAGADVDFGRKLVKFPEYLVKECLGKAPSTIKLYNRRRDSFVELGCGKPPLFASGTGPLYVNDLDTGDRRRGTLKDLEDAIRIVDALEHIQIVSAEAVHPADVPPGLSLQYSWATAFKNTSKHLKLYQGNARESKDAIKMASIIAGNEDELRRCPFVTFGSCLPQVLCFDKGLLEGLIEVARQGLPVNITSGGMAAATSPATLAGTLLQCNAEILGGIAMTQIISPKNPVIYSSWGRTFDIRAENVSISSPEFALLRIAHGQLAKYYGLPASTNGWVVDSKTLDVEAGFEKFVTFISTMTDGNEFVGAGCLDGAAITDFASYVIDNELGGIAQRMFKGFEVNTETLAVEVIKKIGAGSGRNYLSTSHTMKHYRNEQWTGYKISDRRKWTSWNADGATTAYERARDEAKKILAIHVPERLPADVQKEIDAVLQRARTDHGQFVTHT